MPPSHDRLSDRIATRRHGDRTGYRSFSATEIQTGFGGALGFARIGAVRGLRMTLAWQIARLVLRLGFAAALAMLAGRMIEDGAFSAPAFFGAIITLALSAGTGFLADWQAAHTETRVAEDLRAALSDALARMSPAKSRSRGAGQIVAGLQRHPDRVASLVVGHAAAKTMLGLGPLLAAVAAGVVSLQAALTLVLAVPVMVVFFVLFGGAVRSKAAAQERSFGRLAAQFADRIRTLPTILANHAVARERGKIGERMAAYADSTMGVLGLAFLNAGVIDFFSALAIAVLAVFLGLGHLGLLQLAGFSGLALSQSLFILLAAAEFFVPFRRFAEQYHLKAEGEAAANDLAWYFDNAESSVLHHRPGFAAAAFAELADRLDAASLPANGLVVVSGPSGAGKSTLLRMLAGIEPPAAGIAALPQVAGAGCAWMATDIYVPAGTLGDVIAWNCAGADRAALQRAADTVGLLDEKLLPGGLDARIVEGGANLSGGQRLRIGIARSLIASGIVIADEPTAKLDARTAALVRRALIGISKTRLAIVATHDGELIDVADRHLVLSPPRPDAAIAA